MRIRTLNFLPEIFQTPTNAQFLNATLDQLVNPPVVKKIEGYIGSKIGYGINANDYYLTEPTKSRTDYQLDPGVVFTKPDETVAKDFLSYPGLLDALKLQGSNVSNNSNLFNSQFYSWDSFCNLDTLINFNEYYWIAEGLPSVNVSAGITYLENDYVVNSNDDSYTFIADGETIELTNPTITLLRGGSYTFEVDQSSSFYIQGEPGLSGDSFNQPNLSTRDILGVTNNGISQGTITFDVPLKTAQNQYNFPTTVDVDLVCTLPYSSINGQLLSTIGNIDGITSLDGLNILFYNTGSGNPIETTNFYTISYTGSTSNPTIVLTAGYAIPTNIELNVLYGTNYIGRSLYRSISGTIELVPYISAELDVLYYQDGTDANKFGQIRLIDSNLTDRIDVVTDILGKRNYTSPNGVVFTNGLKVTFDGDIFPTSYNTGEYYVQGVGTAIELIRTTNLVTLETYTSNIPSPYSVLNYDFGPYDTILNVPVQHDYITIARNSLNNNAWSRNNRWFHIDVIRATANYNNDSTIVDEYATYENKAKRPIIEFYPNLKLINTGIVSKGLVDFYDNRATDALTTVAGQYNYYPDVDTVTDYTATINGAVAATTTTITVPASDVTGTFVVGQYLSDIYETPTVSVIPTNAYITNITGTTTLTITIAWVGAQTFSTSNNASIVAAEQTLNNYELFDGCKIIFGADENLNVRSKIYVVNYAVTDIANPPVITLTEAVDGTILDNNQVVITDGALQVGKTYYYLNDIYNLAQVKTALNQAPLFDVFDSNGISFSNETIYEGTSFVGCKLFNYGLGDGLDDVVLGFPLRYSFVDNLGDISFDVSFNSDTFNYVSGTTPITENVKTGYVYNYSSLTTYERNLGWQTAISPSVQYQVFEFDWYVTTPTTSFTCDIPILNQAPGTMLTTTVVGEFADIYATSVNQAYRRCLGVYPDQAALDYYVEQLLDKTLSVAQMEAAICSTNEALAFNNTTQWPNIKVFINNVFQLPSTYSVVSNGVSTTVLLDVDSLTDTKVQVYLLSNSVSESSYYTIPINLSNNPFNTDITTVNVGEIRLQYSSIFSNNPNIQGQLFGANNYRDLGNLVPYGTTIIENSSSMVLPSSFLRLQNHNLFDSLLYNSRSYIKFKNLLVDTVNQITNNQTYTPSTVLDNALEYINMSKSDTQPFFWSDMIPNKAVYVVNEYIFKNDFDTSIFPLTQVYNFASANYNGVLVYVFRTTSGVTVEKQLTKGVDYTVSTTSPSLTVTYDLLENDVVVVKEYNQTYGSYVPNTPTKLGLYPSFVPNVVLDSSYSTPTYFILGHDGSYNKLYGNYDPVLGLIDFRDQALLEFEKRVYNNIKLSTEVLFRDYDVLPGFFRSTQLSLEDFLEIYSEGFLNWVGTNRLEYKEQVYNSNNQFTYNYWQSGNKINEEPIFQGFWRGINLYFYDTSTPNLTPWEMLGLVDKPTWWESRYGPAPYTSDNLVLWTDLSQGIVYNNGDPYVVKQAIRPELLRIIPVDSNGDLLSPLSSVVGNYTSTLFKRQWKIGDVAPVEYSYRKSSTWPFDLVRIFALTKPAEFFNLAADLDNYKYSTEFNQYLVNNRSHLIVDDIEIYGSGTAKTSYINWIVDFEKQLGIDATTNITNLLYNTDVRLVYRLAGYSDKTFLKFFVEKSNADATNSSLLIPDESYALLLYENQPFDRIVYSAVVVQSVPTGFAVYGNSQNAGYFKISAPLYNGNFEEITVENVTVKVTTNYSDKITIVPYGTIFRSSQELAQFLASYSDYLIKQGLKFEEIENGVEINFTQAIGEFLYWTQIGFDIGNIITINPSTNRLVFDKDSYIVQPLLIQKNNFILNQNLYPIQNNDLCIERYQTKFDVKALNEGDAISYSQFNVSNFEHAIVFDNLTLFNDTIYNLITGSRQDRILLKGVKTADWNGTVTASGFILNQDNITEYSRTATYVKGEIVLYKNKYWTALKTINPSANFVELDWKETDYNEIQKGLLPNSSTRSYESALYYNVNQANLEQDSNLLAYSLIGYRPRDYLALVDLTDTAQIQVYKNFIRNKGTNLSLNTFKGATLPQGGIEYDVYENWAIKTQDFGGTTNNNFFEVVLNENYLTGNPSILSLTNGQETVGSQQVIPLNKIYNYNQPVTTPNILPTIENYTPSLLFPDAGFVNFDDVKMSSYFYNDLPAAVNKNNTFVPITNFYVGNYVWIADFLGEWQVYGWEAFNRVVSMRGNVNGTTTIRFANPHSLRRTDPISILNFNNAADGYYFVLAVVNTYEVIINLTLNVNNNQLTGEGIALKFVSHKVDTPADISSMNLLPSEFVKNKVWVKEDENGSWAVYQKSINYALQESFTEDSTVNYGSSVAYSSAFGYLVGDPDAGIVYRYTINPVTGQYELFETLTQGTSFGSSITYTDNYVIISEPNSATPKVYIYVVNTDSTVNDNFILVQTLKNPNAIASFGESIDISRDKNYLYISEINNSVSVYDKVYVYVRENIPLSAGFFVPGQTYVITEVGTTNFTSIGAIQNQVGIIFVATGVGTGTGTATQVNYRLSPYNSGYIVAPAYNIDFGTSVTTDYNGDTVFIGAPGVDYDINTSNTGESYVYNRTYQQFEAQYNSILFGYQLFTLGWTASQVTTTAVSTNGTTDVITCNYVADIIIGATSIEAGKDYVILSVGTTNFTLIGASSNTVGVTFTATAAGTGTGKVYRPLLPVIFTGEWLDSLVQIYKVYFISSITEVTPGVTFNITIKEDRNGSSNLPIVSETFTPGSEPSVYFQTNDLIVSKNGTVVTNENYGVAGTKFVYTQSLLAGDLIQVNDSKFALVQTLEASSDPTPGVSFGYATDMTKFGTELLVGAPYDLNNQEQEGAVYRYTNAGGKYGLVVGTKATSVITPRTFYINGFRVDVPAASNATKTADAINKLSLPNIIASATEAGGNGRLIISVIDSNQAVVNEKLLITVYDNAVATLNALGLTLYTETQVIKCPHKFGPTQFGSSIKFNENTSVVIGAPVGTRFEFTSFDFTDDENLDNDTIFDNNSTQFIDTLSYTGAVYMYDYLPAYNESISTPGQFVYAQSLNDNSQDVGPVPRYGHSVDFNENNVIVGSPTYSFNEVDGKVVIYNNATGIKDWHVYRTSANVVDINRIQNIQIYDVTTNNTIINLDYIDPLQGKILGAARQNLDYISNIDPAGYNSNNSNLNGIVWGSEQVGKLWFNTSNVRFVNYHQNDVVYNSKYWGTVFPGSDVAVYSWITSDRVPSEYVGPGTPLNTTLYVTQPVVNASGQLSNVYYYWVRNTNIIFSKTGKTLADSIVESYIQNPIMSGISYFEPLLPNTFALYNCQNYFYANNSILHVGYTTERSSDIPHSEYTLIRVNNASDFLPGLPSYNSTEDPYGLYLKMLDSLSGVNQTGEVVPDPYLPPAVRSGIDFRPRQSFFFDRFGALKNYIQYANTVMKQFPIMEIKTDLDFLYQSFNEGTKLDTTVEGPFAQYYSDLVNSFYINCIGRYAELTGLNFWVNILVNNQLSVEQVETSICSSPEALRGRLTPFNTSNFWTTINWWAPGYDNNTKSALQVNSFADLTTLNVDRGTIVTVGQNVGSQETYIYLPNTDIGEPLQPSIPGTTAEAYGNLINQFYLNCVGRYAEQGGLDYWVGNLVNGLITVDQAENFICSSVEAYNLATNPGWVRIGLQNGTIEISETIYDYSLGKFGFGDNFYSTTPYDEYPSKETYYIIRALNEQIFTNELEIFRNKSLILLFEYIQAETIQSQNYLPWINKTSLVDVSHTLRELLPYENYTTDNARFLESYLNEVKPYHVVIKDFLLKYTGLEDYRGQVTDFDLPALYREDANTFISPNLVYSNPVNNNDFLPSNIIWQSAPYTQWYNNKGLSLTTIENYPATLLASYVQLNTTTITVESVYGFPVNGIIQIDNEQMQYYGIDLENNQLLQVVRGLNGTFIDFHIPGVDVLLNIPPIVIFDGGRDYVEPPKITAVIDTTQYPEPAEQMLLQPVMNNGSLFAVEVVNPGKGYMTMPEIIVEPSETITFSSADVNSTYNVIRVFAPNLQTGDLVQYKNGSGNKIGGLLDGQWYYVNVIDTQPSAIIGLYATYVDAINNTHKVEFYTKGTGTDHTLNLGARCVATVTSTPTRELKTVLRFDRNTYRPRVTDWVAGSFYAGIIADPPTGLINFASSSIQLQATVPPINSILASAQGVTLLVDQVSNDRVITFSEFPRRVIATNGSNNRITLAPYDSSAGFSTASGSTFGFTIGMPIQFGGPLQGGLFGNVTYYVDTIVSLTEFTISETQFGPTYALTSSTLPLIPGVFAYAGTITDTAVLTLNYPKIVTVTETLSNNRIVAPLTDVYTDGTTEMYTGVEVMFVGTPFGDIVDNFVYYVSAVLSDETFTISRSANIVTTTLSQTSSTGNLITVDDTSEFTFEDPIVFDNFVITSGNFNIGVTYTILSLENTDYTALGSTHNIVGTEFVATGTGTFTAGSFIPGYEYVIVSVGSTNFTLIGAVSNTVGVKFIATGVGSGTGTASQGTGTASVSSFGGITAGTFYYVSNVVSATTMEISTVAGGSSLALTNEVGSGRIINQSDIEQLSVDTGSMTMNIAFPVSPGIINGQEFTLYDTSVQYPNLVGTPGALWTRTIDATIGGPDSTAYKVALQDPGVSSLATDYVYYNMPLTITTSNIGGLVAGTTYYVIEYSGRVNIQTGAITPALTVAVTQTVAPSTILCTSAENLYIGMPVSFDTGLGGLVATTEYYVASISYAPGNNSFTVSATPGGSAFTVVNASGTTTGVGPQFIQLSTTRGGSAVVLTQTLGPQTIAQATTTVTNPEFSIYSILGGYQTIIVNQGEGWVLNNTFTISGTSLGGTSPTNDCVLTVTGIDNTGSITNVIKTGTPAATSNTYYLNVLTQNTVAVYEDPLFQVPVDGLTFPQVGLTENTITEINLPSYPNTITSTNGLFTGFNVNDTVYFSGTVGGGIVAYQPYYIHSILTISPSAQKIYISEEPGGSIMTLSYFDANSNMTIAKVGSIAFIPEPIVYDKSLVKYNNKVWECVISNNDSEFVLGKWELLESSSRKLNALDRVIGYYAPTVNMPGKDLTQLMTGLTYPYTTYKGNDFDPAYQFTVETILQGQEFYPREYTNTGVTSDGTNIIVAANGTNESILSKSSDTVTYDIQKLTAIPIGITSIVYTGSKYLISSTNSASPILTSNNGTVWSVANSAIGVTLNSVSYDNNVYLAAGDKIIRSTNGSTWATVYTFPVGPITRTLYDVREITTAIGNSYVAVGQANFNNSVIVVSSDSINWGIIPSISRNGLYSVTDNGTLAIAVGKNGFIAGCTDGLTWFGINETPTISVNLATNVLNVNNTAGFNVGDTVRFTSSFDVISSSTSYTISNILSSTQLQLTAVTFTNSVTSGSMYLYPRTANLNHVHYANGKYVAVGNIDAGEGIIRTSTNGYDWTTISGTIGKQLNSVTFDASSSTWIAVGNENSIIYSVDNAVTWQSDISFNVAQPAYTIQGSPFQYGYGPEEMVPGLVEDNLTVTVNTRPGTNWLATTYQHVGYNVVSNVYTPSPSNQVTFSYANTVSIPAQVACFVIDSATQLSTSIYQGIDYTVDWVNQTITLNSPLTVGDELRLDVYEVGNGDQLVKSNTFGTPLRENQETGFVEIYLNCNYSATINNGSGVIQDLPYTTTINATETEASFNTITLDNVTNVILNGPIVFQGTVFGGIVAGTTYYVKFINSETNSIVVSLSNVGGIAGPAVTLTNATGSMTAIISSGAGVPWVDPFMMHNGSKLVIGRTNLALATLASSNAVVTNSTGGITAGDTVIFDDNMFGGVLLPQTSYTILNVIDSTKFRIEDPSNPGNPLSLTNSSGSSVFVTNDYAIALQPNKFQPKVVFANQYDATNDYLVFSFFGESEPAQYGYAVPETETFTATPGQTTFSLSNYVAFDNETDAIVEINGVRTVTGYTIDFGLSNIVFTTPFVGGEIVAVTTFNDTFRQYLNSQFNIQGLSTTITNVSLGPDGGAMVTLTASLGLSDGDGIRFGGVTGTTQLNDKTFYVRVIAANQYELYNRNTLDNMDLVVAWDAFTGAGYAWGERAFTLTTTTVTRTFTSVNRINVASIENLEAGTPIYFTTPTTVNGDTLVGGLIDNQLYWILEVGPSVAAGSFLVGENYIIEDLGDTNWNAIGYVGAPITGGEFTATGVGSGTGTAFAKAITVALTQFGDEVAVTNEINTANITQFYQTDTDRLWVTVNGYRVPSDRLQVYNNAFFGISMTLSNVTDYVSVTSMMPSASPNELAYFNIIDFNNEATIYKTTVNTTTWLVDGLSAGDDTIYVQDVSKVLQYVEVTETCPASVDNTFTFNLNQISNNILNVTAYNNTLSIAIPNNIITRSNDGNQPTIVIENNATYINAGDSITITTVLGGLIYVNGEQIRFADYDIATNTLTDITRGANGTPVIFEILKYTLIFAMLPENMLGSEYYGVVWNTQNVYNTNLTDPLQISTSLPAVFLQTDITE